jgi:membrane-associated phospholipid phosphatase
MISESRFSDKRAIWLVLAAAAALMVLFVVFERFLFLPKILMVGLILLAAVLMGKIKPLARDWFVFMAFIYLFDSLRGIIYILTCRLQLPAYALYVLNIEKTLFRGVPSVALQKLLLHPDPAGNFGWLEKTLTVCYGSHFIAFLFVGFLIWLSRPKAFSLYKSSFYLLVFLGELGYALVPTVPPWMAANHFGLIPPLTHFNIELFNVVIPDISSGFDTNPIAAMPSLHAGFPILCSILLWRLYRWKGIPFYLYTLSVIFAIVYSGDHYLTDILAGGVLAVACYIVGGMILKRRRGASEAESGTQAEIPFGGAALRKRILLGLGVFLIGVIIGGINKTQFRFHISLYNPDIPRYVDFFRHEDRYQESYLIQHYFGNHFLALNDYRTALGYLERSLKLARNHIESKEAQQDIAFCRRMLGPKG